MALTNMDWKTQERIRNLENEVKNLKEAIAKTNCQRPHPSFMRSRCETCMLKDRL